MGGNGNGRKSRNERFRPAYAPPLYRPAPVQAQPKRIEYELVDLLGAEGIGDKEIEALRVVLFFVAAQRKREAIAAEESEIAALRHDLERVMAREHRFLNALMSLVNTPGEAGEIAADAVFGRADAVASDEEGLEEGAVACAAFEDRITKEALPGEDRDATAERLAIANHPEIAAQGIEARSAMTEGHDPKDESPVTK